MRTTFDCLYTRHLTQKHKQWLDGTAVIWTSNGRVRVQDESDRLVAEQFVFAKPNFLEPGKVVKIDRYLVEILDIREEREEEEEVKETPILRSLTETRARTARKSPLQAISKRICTDAPLKSILEQVSVKPIKPNELRNAYKRPARPQKRALPANPIPVTPVKQLTTNIRREEPDLSLISSEDGIFICDRNSEDRCPISSPQFPPEFLHLSSQTPDETTDEEDAHMSQYLCLSPPSPQDRTSDSLNNSPIDSIRSEGLYSSEVEITRVEPAEKNALFNSIPPSLPKQGPWTKEAYILFSWHPPPIKKEV